MISKNKQIKFYNEELEEIELEVKATFESPASALFNSGEIYIGQFRGFDRKRGNVFFDIPDGKGKHTPRVDQLMNCFKLLQEKMLPKQWGNTTYSKLLAPLNSELDMSETKLVEYMESERKGWITMILSGMDIRFINSLRFNDLLAFGPTIPPFEYLINLKKFTENTDENGLQLWNKVLNFDYNYIPERKPKLIDESIDIAGFIINEVDKNIIFIFQGPPGTGKTHQIADVVSRLANNNKSVLVTALTNKAAIEACEKPFLEELIDQGRVSKTSLSSNEKLKYPKLDYAEKILPVPGKITLSTYYQFSKIWGDYEQAFDYIIVEEASQAFLTTIAAALKVGKHVIVVGDPLQIQPIVKFKNYKKISEYIDLLVNGLQTVCEFEGIPFYRKIETRRLTKRATDYTNSFYQNTMLSKSLFKDLNSDINDLKFLGRFIHFNGGPTLMLKDLTNMDNIIPFLVQGIDDITTSKKGSIAVLSPFIGTVKFLQKTLKLKTQSKKYLIDTVDRVQGLDVDYCFYIIPDQNYGFSFKLNRFNVATSRSKKATFILADRSFYKKTALTGESGKYLTKLLNDYCFIQENDNTIKKINLESSKKKEINNSSKIKEIDDIAVELSNKGLINLDGFYNSLLEDGKVLAEAEFVIQKGDIKIAVEPFSEEDERFFKKENYKIINLKELKELFHL